MPDGAQAWKMIKPPGSSTDRIAQACDRCRSKKIRCDGLRPRCSQCKNVGVECRLSDKLTRRSFPRGYTESLEDRLRQLESENNKLISLLDIKDEQIEMMSKLAGDRSGGISHAKKQNHMLSSSCNSENDKKSVAGFDEDDEMTVYSVKHSNKLTPKYTYRGAAAGGVFVDALIEKFKIKAPLAVEPVKRLIETIEKDRMVTEIELATPESILSPLDSVGNLAYASSGSGSTPNNLSSWSAPTTISTSTASTTLAEIPSRVVCDKLITIYFQEWHSMYDIEDQQAFLNDYEKFMEGKDIANKDLFTVRLLLVLSLALLVIKDNTKEYDDLACSTMKEWKRLFTYNLQSVCSLDTVRALNLACLYSLHRGCVEDIWQFRMALINLIQRMGLYRTQQDLKTISGQELGTKQKQERKKLFWASYMQDAFSAVFLGSPRLLHEMDIECELPSCSNECSMALLKFVRVLVDINSTIYSTTSHTHTYKEIIMLEDKLETWKRDMPKSLQFEFIHGKPAATLSPVHQKSPILLILYNYAKLLIHLPALSNSTDGDFSRPCRSSGATVAVMQSVKTYLEVFNYLRTRNVVCTLPFNPSRLAILFTTITLYNGLGYSRAGALFKDVRSLVASTLKILRSELKINRPGGIANETYQWLEQVCDVVLTLSSKRNSEVKKKSSISGNSTSPNTVSKHAFSSGISNSINSSSRNGQGRSCAENNFMEPPLNIKTEAVEIGNGISFPSPLTDSNTLNSVTSCSSSCGSSRCIDDEMKALDDLIMSHNYSRLNNRHDSSQSSCAASTSPTSDGCVEPASLFMPKSNDFDNWNFDEYNMYENFGDMVDNTANNIKCKQEDPLTLHNSRPIASIPIPTSYMSEGLQWKNV